MFGSLLGGGGFLKWLLGLLLLMFGVGCSGKLTNTTLTFDSIPKSIASLHIEAPDLLIEGHVDPVKGVKVIVNETVSIIGSIMGPPAPEFVGTAGD